MWRRFCQYWYDYSLAQAKAALCNDDMELMAYYLVHTKKWGRRLGY